MKDTIIKGTGNSRTLGSVPNLLTLYPTYEAFARALINREFPIDLGPLNPAGVQQAGMDLNKANLLKDATAAAYGLTAAAVPDEVLAKARQLITAAQGTADGRGRIAVGTYVGTGKYGSANKNQLTVGFAPKAMIIFLMYYQSYTTHWQMALAIKSASAGYGVIGTNYSGTNPINGGYMTETIDVEWSDTGLTWYKGGGQAGSSDAGQMNISGKTYGYIVFG